MRVSNKTRNEANDLINIARKLGLKKFDLNEFGLSDRERLHRMIQLAKSHCLLQERACNGDLTQSQIKRELSIEKSIALIAESFDLQAEFQGDPRGFTVKLHAKTKGFYNTWGGQESGYGIGEN
jgi:hypothetical protein